MRKLFRFKYEPCNKTCYQWCHTLTTELNQLSPDERQSLVSLMVLAHARLCDNPDYSFGVDINEKSGTFVAYFRTPTSTDTFADDSFSECVEAVCEKVLNTEIPKTEGFCLYGDNGAEDLGNEILKACTDIAYREEHHQACPCQSLGV